MMSRSLYTLLALARLSSSRNDRMCTETSHGRFPTKSLVSSGLRSHGVRVMGWWEIGIGRARARGEFVRREVVATVGMGQHVVVLRLILRLILICSPVRR